MAFCRFGRDSDVYVFEGDDGFDCCACILVRGGFTAPSPAGMIAHLLEHRAAGHRVPDRALDELRQEAESPPEP